MELKKQIKLIFWVVACLFCGGAVLWVSRKSAPALGQSSAGADKRPNVAPASASNEDGAAPPAERGQEGATTNAPQQFLNMNVLERDKVIREIMKQDLTSVFRIWIEAGHVDHDLMKQSGVAAALAYAMRERAPSAELIEQMRAFIADRANSAYERAQLLGTLGRSATKESLDLLIQSVATLSDEDMRQVAIAQIQSVGGYAQWEDGSFHEELSPALERVWRESGDQNLLASAGMALAKIGAPSGIELLFSSALNENSPNDIQVRIAQGSLPEVLNAHAVPTLSAFLASQQPTSATSKLASSTLANMVDATSAAALVNWLQTADDSAAPLARDSVLRTRSPAHLAAWESALDRAVPFRSEKNRDAIRTALAEYHRGHR